MLIEFYIKKGNSFPLVLSNNGRKFFVKLRAGMSGKNALLNEWICNQIGIAVGLNTQQPQWMSLTEDLDVTNLPIEVRELIQKSSGLNITFGFLEEKLDLELHDLSTLREEERTNIFLFDLFTINIDRTEDNLNLMKVGGTIIDRKSVV